MCQKQVEMVNLIWNILCEVLYRVHGDENDKYTKINQIFGAYAVYFCTVIADLIINYPTKNIPKATEK